jgi:hypothetical protein
MMAGADEPLASAASPVDLHLYQNAIACVLQFGALPLVFEPDAEAALTVTEHNVG